MNIDDNSMDYTGQDGPQQQQQQLPSTINPSEATASTVNDIDSGFLEQFMCLGTTDHDELIEQFLMVVERKVNANTAKFFLDMTNWGLQAAVGCYFDFCGNITKYPSMQLLEDVTYGRNESVTPNTKFTHSFKVRNNGDETWPFGCYLYCESPSGIDPIPLRKMDAVENLKPGQETVLTITLVSPMQIGTYTTIWKLSTPYAISFGDTINSIVDVSETGTLALTQQLATLATQTPSPINDPSLSLVSDDADMC